jgi:3-deoxy-7-phosphoheptulonate synthase
MTNAWQRPHAHTSPGCPDNESTIRMTHPGPDRHIADLHIARDTALPTPRELLEELPCTDAQAAHIAVSRDTVRCILRGEDPRLLVVVGPCSIHEPASAIEYAQRLKAVADRLGDALFPVMRVYFEKPRTRMGWKGLIYDPGMDGEGDIGEGLRAARRILLECAKLGVPAASEILDLVTPQYYAELLSWGAIGARTVESPLHRQMASALSAPLGFKNATNGSVTVAIDAIHVAAQAHTFPSISLDGRAIVVTTTGNPDAHLVLRGANGGPNYDDASVASAAKALSDSGLTPRLLVDCSHGNSAKDYRRQPEVAADIARQIAAGPRAIAGILLESHLVEGRQDITNGRDGLRYGQSVTDGCIGWDATVAVLEGLATAVRTARPA